MKTKVNLFKREVGVEHLSFLSGEFGTNKTGKLFEGEVSNTFLAYVELSEADFILLPHNYFSIKKNIKYLNELIDLSEKTGLKVIVFAYGDSDEDINIPNSIILRTSQYKYKKKHNEIIIPPLVENLGLKFAFVAREKQHLPTVGFVGWAGFGGRKYKLKYFIKNQLNSLLCLFDRNKESHKKGIFFRIRALKILKNSHLISTNFIVRKTYSGHSATISEDPVRVREEYIKNIIDSDFTLSVKGDGNYSARFFETLSLGRIPLMVDTETLLPLEGIINYDKFILRASFRDIKNLDTIVSSFYRNLSNDDFINMQRLAIQTFGLFLTPEKFFEYVFSYIIKYA